MRQHRRQHMVVPAGVFPHGIVVHPALRFAFCAAWLDGPPQPASPDKGAQGRAHGGMTHGGRIGRLSPSGALDHEPDGALWQAVLAERHALAGKLLDDRPLGPFRDLAPVPARGRQTRRQCRPRARSLAWGHHDTLRAYFPLLPVGLLLGPRRLEPAACVRRKRDQRRAPNTRVDGVQTGWALALEAIRSHVLAWQEALLRDGLYHRRSPLGVALQAQLGGDVARGSSSGRRGTPPHFRQEEAVVRQGVALPRRLADTHADLTMLSLPEGPTVLPGAPRRVLPLFAKA